MWSLSLLQETSLYLTQSFTYHSSHPISIQSFKHKTQALVTTVSVSSFPLYSLIFARSLHCDLDHIPMATPCSSRNRTNKTYLLLHGMQVSITVAFIFSLTVLLLPTKSGGSGLLQGRERDTEDQESKKVIGSKPPSCVNKCMKCRPCLATVVAPDHRRKKNNNKDFKVWSTHGGEDDDDPYYLLSWKCSCGDKLFKP